MMMQRVFVEQRRAWMIWQQADVRTLEPIEDLS